MKFIGLLRRKHTRQPGYYISEQPCSVEEPAARPGLWRGIGPNKIPKLELYVFARMMDRGTLIPYITMSIFGKRISGCQSYRMRLEKSLIPWMPAHHGPAWNGAGAHILK